jgi:hypothetical protein
MCATVVFFLVVLTFALVGYDFLKSGFGMRAMEYFVPITVPALVLGFCCIVIAIICQSITRDNNLP